MKTNFKISRFSRFLLRSEYAIQLNIWKWLKLLSSVPFIKKTLVNQVYIRISHLDWLSQFYSEWRKAPKLVNFQVFCYGLGMLPRSKFWQWLKLFNSVPFIKKRLVTHVYISIWSFWQTFTALQWMKKNFKINQFEDFF